MAHFITEDCTGCTACTAVCPASAIEGERKQPHRILADRCLDCGACGRVCPAASVEDAFGTPVPRLARKAWPKPNFDLDTCSACGICIDACPTQALDIETMKVGDYHAYPWLAREKACIGCGFCAAECPIQAVEFPRETAEV